MKLWYKLLSVMAENEYKKALRTARDEFERVLEERDQLARRLEDVNQRIAKLRPAIADLALLCDEPDDGLLNLVEQEDARELGLTDAIRLVLRRIPKALTPSEVRDRLADMGFNLEKYESVMPPIHTTLNRLAEKGEVLHERRVPGRSYYKWAWKLPDPPPDFALPPSLKLAMARNAFGGTRKEKKNK